MDFLVKENTICTQKKKKNNSNKNYWNRKYSYKYKVIKAFCA